MPEQVTVGEAIVALLEASGVTNAFGVVSIHNLPFLDAVARRGNIRFVPARGEAGAANMADANARVSGTLGVFVTSTGTGAGNACGAQVEAQTAGTPLLHLTGQIDSPHLDKNRAFIHEARDQLGMLKSVSKAAFRVTSAETAVETVSDAIRIALSAPAGPVSVEIPIDIQKTLIDMPALQAPEPDICTPDEEALDRLADALSAAKRPMLWLGGGARHATDAVARLVEMGFGVVTSAQGRGILPEHHPASLGAFNAVPKSEEFFERCDAMLVAGSRLRGNETLGYRLGLPTPLYHIDADAESEGRCYPCEIFLHGDSALTLSGLADRLDGKITVDSGFQDDIAAARQAAEADLRAMLGPYEALMDSLAATIGDDDFIWVRDITLSNSIWGNRMLTLKHPARGVHAAGGGIGQGLPMAVGAATGSPHKVICLTGDGGLQLCLGELGTAIQENANILILLMNDAGYGVIRNIQDAGYGGRHDYTDVTVPNFKSVCQGLNIPHMALDDVGQAGQVLSAAYNVSGPVLVEIDMTRIGDFAAAFAGPPVRDKGQK